MKDAGNMRVEWTNDEWEDDEPSVTPLFDEALRKEEAARRAQAEREEEPGPADDILPIVEFVWRDPRTYPQRQWVYRHHYIRKFASCTIAPGGLGKSSLNIVESLAMASDQPVLGHRPRKRCKVLIVNHEDPLEEIERRVLAAMAHYGISQEDIAGHLFTLSGRNYKLMLAEIGADQSARINEQAFVTLANTIALLGIDVLILDPFARVHHLHENHNGMMEVLMTRITLLADETDIAIGLVVHTPKGIDRFAEPSAEEARGGGAIGNGVRVARVLRRMTQEEGTNAGVTNHREYFRAFSAKLNMSPPVAESEWFHLFDYDMDNGTEECPAPDRVGVVTQWEYPDAFCGVTPDKVAAVQQAIARQPCRAHESKDGTWVGSVIADTLNFDLTGAAEKAGKTRAKKLIKTWLETGLLVEVQRKDSHGDLRPFIEVGKPINDDHPL